MSIDRELIEAIEAGDGPVVRSLLEAGASPEVSGGANSIPALHIAVGRGRVDLVNLLIAAGANPNRRDVTGLTPMMLAACRGDLDAVELLLKSGADVNARDFNGTTSLMLAQGHDLVVEALLRAGADVNAKSEGQGLTALMYACDSGNIKCVRLCLDAGADVDQKDHRDWSAIEFARHRKKWQSPHLPGFNCVFILGRIVADRDPIIEMIQRAARRQ
jgi:uncharacterized protein